MRYTGAETHIVEFTFTIDDDDERALWECSCGASGRVLDVDTDMAIERHLAPGDHCVYRHRATRADRNG